MKGLRELARLRIVASASKCPTQNPPAVRLGQGGRPCCPTLGPPDSQVDSGDMEPSCTDRTCRFEQMEPRQLLAADLAPIPLGPALAPTPGLLDGLPAAIGTSLGSIAGQVTLAADNAGLEGVVLRLLDQTGGVVDQTQTDAQGNYGFPNLSPGIYAVHEVQPTGMPDGGASIGNGSGIALDPNLLGEIVVDSGSNLVDYNFYEQATDELSETGADQRLVAHTPLTPQNGAEVPASVVLQLLLDSASRPLPQHALPLESPVVAAPGANVPRPLPATPATPAPFFGSLEHAKPQPIAGDWDGIGFETLDTLHDSLWQLDFDDAGRFTNEERADLLGESDEVPATGGWNDGRVDNLGVFREDLWILDHLGDQELEAQDYDRALELGEVNNQQAMR